ncbi:MAG: S-layer homology domain-containing protein [Chloroflexota bacterium]
MKRVLAALIGLSMLALFSLILARSIQAEAPTRLPAVPKPNPDSHQLTTDNAVVDTRYSVSATPSECTLSYTYTTSTGSIVPATSLVPGSQCNRCIVPLTFPFPVTLYGQSYITANVSNYGNLQFTSADSSTTSCPMPSPQLGPALFPYWYDGVYTSWPEPCMGSNGLPCGVYTSVSGSAPNRLFYVEWRALLFGSNHETVDYEIRFHENSDHFEFVYGVGVMFGYNTVIGVQDGGAHFTEYACNVVGSYQNEEISWTPVYAPGCEPTVTPTPTITTTATNTPTPTATFSPYCAIVINDSITNSDPTQAGILNFVHTPTVCQYPQRPSPGNADSTPRHVKRYFFHNPFGSFSFQCVNIRLDSACSGNLFSVAYMNGDYTGDLGDPVVGSGSYDIDIFRGTDIVFTVVEVTPNSGCDDFTLTITPQNQCLTTPTITITPTPTAPTTATPISTTQTATFTATASATAMPSSTTPGATVTAMPSSTILTATATPSRTTLTTTPTATACTIDFTDVPVGSTFYPFVHCLACLGIMQGYPDGTYRPGSEVTRGQAAKILANSAGYNDVIPPTRQTFNDVPPGSTFWLYIERIALHNAINGYPCDGAGEPCPGTYYRPQNNLTRGQIAKITAITAGYNDPIPPTRQTFSDVPLSSTFWLYIERVALHGVVGGYPDNTYRPQNPVTRGQIAKIAANAFFPGCGD